MKSPLNIVCEQREWGTRLIVHPLAAPLSVLEISAEVYHQKDGKNPEIKIWFNSVPISNHLRPTDVMIWVNSLNAMMQEARMISEGMKPSRTSLAAEKAKKKKTAKKKVKK